MGDVSNGVTKKLSIIMLPEDYHCAYGIAVAFDCET